MNEQPTTDTGTPPTVDTYLGGSVWREEWKRSEGRVRELQESIFATCRGLGAAGYYLSGSCTLPDADRLVRLGVIVTELRAVLGLPDLDDPTAGRAFAADASDGGRL